MEPHGFIRDILDVKILILFVTSKVQYPVSLQKIYELCYQDDCLSYFDVSVAVPDMVESGHLKEVEKGLFEITAKGREHEEVTCDAIAYPVMQRAQAAVERFNREAHRRDLVRTQTIARKEGDFSVVMSLDDNRGNLMTLELEAPTRDQAAMLERSFHKRAETLFRLVMEHLLEEEKNREPRV